MKRVIYNGHSAIVRNLLFNRVGRTGKIFYIELVGCMDVEIITNALLSGHSVYLEDVRTKDDDLKTGNDLKETSKGAINLSLYRDGEEYYIDKEGIKRTSHMYLSWRRRKRIYGVMRHTIMYPEDILNNCRNEIYPKLIIGRNFEEARKNLYNFLNIILDFPIPEGEDLKYLLEFIEKENKKEKSWEIVIKRIQNTGNVYGWLIYEKEELQEVLRGYYAGLIKKKAIYLKGKEVKLKENTLEAFLAHWEKSLIQKVIENYKPVYEIGKVFSSDIKEKLNELKRKLFKAQEEVVTGIYEYFRKTKEKGVILCGELGTGKTIMSLAASYLLGSKRVLVIVPPHLVRKWKREITQTIPNAEVIDINGKDGVKKLQNLYRQITEANTGTSNLGKNSEKKANKKKIEFYVVGRERLKLGAFWKPAVIPVLYRDGKIIKIFSRKADSKDDLYGCPHCGHLVMREEKKERIAADWKWLSRAKRFCIKCGSPLWEVDNTRIRRMSVAEFIKRKLKNVFDLVIVDECHEYKTSNSSQSQALGGVISVCKRVIQLTGTLAGGYVLDIYFMYFRLFSKDFIREGWRWEKVNEFIKRYGVIEEVEVMEVEEEDNRSSKGKKRTKVYIKQKPGISPEALVKFILPKTFYIKLEDIEDALPEYEEYYIAIDGNGEDKGEYERCLEAYKIAIQQCKNSKSRLKLASRFIPVLMNLPDGVRHWVGEIWAEVYNEFNEEIEKKLLYRTERVSGDLLAKERWLVELIRREKEAGRKVMVFCTFTDKGRMNERLQEVLTKTGFKVKVLKSSIKAMDRERWIEENVKDLDVLIGNPKLVETGLDLFDFPTLIFYQPNFRVYTLRQASRRSWRIGQERKVKVYFLAKKGTIQEDAWELIAEKWKVSAAIEGEIISSGLATEFDSSGNILNELAKRLENGKIGEITADSIFKRMKKAEVLANTYITQRDIQEEKGKIEIRAEKIEIRAEVEVKEVVKEKKSKTLMISVVDGKTNGKQKARWTKMEVKAEKISEIKDKIKRPLQLMMF